MRGTNNQEKREEIGLPQIHVRPSGVGGGRDPLEELEALDEDELLEDELHEDELLLELGAQARSGPLHVEA